jgi:hypothetical protein
MFLTIDNSAPHAALTCGGTYKLFAPVYLGGQVADFDGDLLTYRWLDGETWITSGQIQSLYGGTPVSLPGFSISFNTVYLSFFIETEFVILSLSKRTITGDRIDVN